jgi:hypothetical protein
MSTEEGEVKSIDPESPEYVAAAQKLIDNISKVKGEDVHCMLGIVVTKDKDGGFTASNFSLGADSDMARMLTTLITVIKNGIAQAHKGTPDGVTKN